MADPAQQPSDQQQREGGLSNRRAQRGGRSNNGPRHRRRQLQEFRAQAARNNSHVTLESPDGWSITAADSAVHNSLWHGVKTDVEHSEASLAVARVNHDKSQSDGIAPISGRQANPDGSSSSSASSAAADDQPVCLLCCEPIRVHMHYPVQQSCFLILCMCAEWSDDLQVVAVGKCNHKDICAECVVQMVMLYKNSQCPLCKGELDQVLPVICGLVFQCASNISFCFSSAAGLLLHPAYTRLTQICRQLSGFKSASSCVRLHADHFACSVQIVITPWVDPEPRDWSHWASILHQLWHKPQWCPQFFVSHDLFPGRYQPLHAYVQQLTARACSICDPEAKHLFHTDGALCKHMTQHHCRHLCMVCLKVGLRSTGPSFDQHIHKNKHARHCHMHLPLC